MGAAAETSTVSLAEETCALTMSFAVCRARSSAGVDGGAGAACIGMAADGIFGGVRAAKVVPMGALAAPLIAALSRCFASDSLPLDMPIPPAIALLEGGAAISVVATSGAGGGTILPAS